jgi:hypothetical protein
VKNRFQSLPFKCILQRYTAAAAAAVFTFGWFFWGFMVGLYKLNSVHP